MTEGVWPKADGDILYASEVNNIPRIKAVSGLNVANTETNAVVFGPYVDVNQYAIIEATGQYILSGAGAQNALVELNIKHGSKGTDWAVVDSFAQRAVFCTVYKADTIKTIHTLPAPEITGSVYIQVQMVSTNGTGCISTGSITKLVCSVI